jgi:hypothetical protein
MATPTLDQALANQFRDPNRQALDPDNNTIYTLDPGTVAAFIAANPYTPAAGTVASELVGVPDAQPVSNAVPADVAPDTGGEHY